MSVRADGFPIDRTGFVAESIIWFVDLALLSESTMLVLGNRELAGAEVIDPIRVLPVN